jgi:hypothetical protein
MIDFGDDTAGECFIVVHGSHRFPRCSATFDRLNNIRLMPVNLRRGPALASVLHTLRGTRLGCRRHHSPLHRPTVAARIEKAVRNGVETIK